MHSRPFYAPDGMGMAGHSPDRAADLMGSTDDPVLQHLFEVVLPHERHDDGLVHSHNWAISSEHRVGGRDTAGYFHPIQDSGPTAPEGLQAAMNTVGLDECYDDGLVHNHHWATTKI